MPLTALELPEPATLVAHPPFYPGGGSESPASGRRSWGEPRRARSGCGLAAALKAIEGEPQPEHRGVDIPETLLVQTPRLGDVGEQLEGAANQLVHTLRPAALEPAPAVRAGALLARHAPDVVASVVPAPAVLGATPATVRLHPANVAP